MARLLAAPLVVVVDHGRLAREGSSSVELRVENGHRLGMSVGDVGAERAGGCGGR